METSTSGPPWHATITIELGTRNKLMESTASPHKVS